MNTVVQAGLDEFLYESIAELNADIPAFDPFDYGMTERDKRDVAETYHSPIAWRPLHLVQACIEYALDVGAPNNFDVIPYSFKRGY